MSGLLLVVLGIWGGLIPFVGPYFGYAFGSHATWHYTTERLWLDILPAAAVVLGGLMLLRSGHRVSGTLASWLAMAGGAWFAVGPAVSRLWEHGPGPIGGPLFGPTRQMLELVGYFYGLGILIVGLAAFALGRFVSRPGIVVEPVAPEPNTAGRGTDIPAVDAPANPYEPAESPERVTTGAFTGS
ncbi:MAG TPA: hypothetical protein VHV75_09245 [Solirubrobacteraceae bacterium]|nr:hypothetical protein [Solirubrobacteraceae bacterium]